MLRKRWLVVALAVGALAAVIVGGTVLAQTAQEDGDSPARSFVSRVATILGIEEDRVQDAFDQAAREMQDEALQQKLDRLVEAGKLAQAEADDIREWYESRPDALNKGFFAPGFGGQGHHGWHKMWHGMGRWKGAPETASPEASPTP